MSRRRKLKSVSLAQPQSGAPLDLRPNVILNRQSKMITVILDNPNYDPRKTPEEQRNVPAKIIQSRSARDPLAVLFGQGVIDEVQVKAGEHWRKCYELCQIGGVRGQNFMREYVDTSPGFQYEPTGLRQDRAWKDLKRASLALGLIGEPVVKKILIDGMFPRQVAESMGYTTERRVRHYTDIFRDALDTLARVWGTDPGAKLRVSFNGE